MTGPPDVFEKFRLRNISDELNSFIDNRLGHAPNRIPLREIWEFSHLDDIGDMFAFDRQLVSQPGDLGTVRTSGRDKNLNVKVFIYRLNGFERGLRQPAFPVGRIQEPARNTENS